MPIQITLLQKNKINKDSNETSRFDQINLNTEYNINMTDKVP